MTPNNPKVQRNTLYTRKFANNWKLARYLMKIIHAHFPCGCLRGAHTFYDYYCPLIYPGNRASVHFGLFWQNKSIILIFIRISPFWSLLFKLILKIPQGWKITLGYLQPYRYNTRRIQPPNEYKQLSFHHTLYIQINAPLWRCAKEMFN